MSKKATIALFPAAAPTATTTSAASEISDFTGIAHVILDAAQPAAGQTLDVKLQHCATSGGTYVDSGIAFAQVTNAGGASLQDLTISVDGLMKYVKAVATIAGGTTALPMAVHLSGNKAL